MEQITDVALAAITLPAQIRTEFSKELIEGMARSLREVGLMQPVRLRAQGERFMPVDGERRIRAARLLGWKSIAAILEASPLSEAALLQKQLISNCQHAALSPLEKSAAIERLMQTTGWPAGQTAARLGLSGAGVSKLLTLTALPDSVREQIRIGKISASAGYELAGIADKDAQAAAATQLAAGELTRDGLVKLKKRSQRPADETKPKAKRATAHLGAGRLLTVCAGELTLDSLIVILEELLGKARKARPQGLVLATFLQMLKDQAGA